MNSTLSTLAFLLMIVAGLGIMLGVIYLIFPPASLFVMVLYLICLLALVAQSRKQEASLASVVVGLPLMIGCLALVFAMLLVGWIPAVIKNFYIATLKGTYRIRESQSRVEIKTQERFTNLASGYRFSFHGEIDKNTGGRKGKIIVNRSVMYLGAEVGWISTPKNYSVFPRELSVDTGEDILEMKSPLIFYPNLKLASTPRFVNTRFSSNKDAIELNIPERPALDADIPIGTRHEWELRVGDELYVEGQIGLQYRDLGRLSYQERRIRYEKFEVVNPREWVVYEPDEDDIAVATREREHRLFVNRTKEAVRTVETIADFMALEAGQRFVIHGTVAEDNEMLWKDYVLYKPGQQFLSGRWTKGGSYDVSNLKMLRVMFEDGTYPFNLTLKSDFLHAPDPSQKSSLPMNGNFKIKFPKLENPTISESVQDKSRVYRVLKAGDRVIVHARKLTDIASRASGVEPPAFGVEQVIVNTHRDWVMHSWQDRSPAELAYWQRQVERDKQRYVKRNTNAGKQLRKSLGLPPTTPRFGQSSASSGSSNRFSQSASPFDRSVSRFGKSGESRFTKRTTSDDDNQNTIEPEDKSKHNRFKSNDDPTDENET